jgi:hypothetical protein
MPSRFPSYAEEILGKHQCGFRRTGQLQTKYSTLFKYLRNNGNKIKQCLLFINFKKVYESVSLDVFYNIIIETGNCRKQTSLIKMCLTETCRRVRLGNHLPDMFPIRNRLKQRDALSPIFSTSLKINH